MRNIATLSLPAFEVLWEDLRAGSIPHPFDIQSHGETVEERARIKKAVHSDLESRNLARRGRPEPELEDALMLLARPELRIVALGMPDTSADTLLRASVVARGSYAVLATQDDRAVNLSLVPDNALIPALVNLLPPMRPGPGKPVTLPIEALKPQEQQGIRQTVRSTANQDVQLFRQMMSTPPIGTGHFTVTLEQGRTKKNFPPVTWIDTEAGRYLNTPGRTPEWITVAPADNNGLARQLSQVLSLTSQR
ncbi:ESX secretion-associated protein EspG [Lentzea sp. NBRC 105346]|uniref:ESX secretion-associated protein EspG n=1 Tax=Lentzea sp. NBRC 105346 TaxID=3032205 RepID=UPI0024A5A8EC|nr:ESX secretion-associated protein EspG [Lentzea sp. NBRC 105346]GLZ30190.1 ESX secretion-associated protein EspG [Lentzea sp. NBRC 105346]